MTVPNPFDWIRVVIDPKEGERCMDGGHRLPLRPAFTVDSWMFDVKVVCHGRGYIDSHGSYSSLNR